MRKILEYTLRDEDLAVTAGGLVNLVLKNCIKVTGHEISGAKFTPDGITADGRKVYVNERIRPGQTLRVVLPEVEDATSRIIAVKPPFAIDILYEDEDLVIVNKPAGVVVHPSPGHYQDTLANYLAWMLEQRGEKSVCRIIGRLDKETSGAIVFAKNRASAARLTSERMHDTLRRTYVALVHGSFSRDGRPSEGSVEAPLDKVPNVLMLRQVVGSGEGHRAVTHYRVLGEFTIRTNLSDDAMACNSSEPDDIDTTTINITNTNASNAKAGCTIAESTEQVEDVTLLELHIDTGRTHQIRVHMASIGHPLVGDTLYNGQYDPQQSYAIEVPADLDHPNIHNEAAGMTEEDDSNCRNADCPSQRQYGKLRPAEPIYSLHVKSMADGTDRALLHAIRLEMVQPFTGEAIGVCAPLPDDFPDEARKLINESLQ